MTKLEAPYDVNDKEAAICGTLNSCLIFRIKCVLQYLGLFGALSNQGERERELEEDERNVQKKTKSIAEFEEPNRVHLYGLYSHKSLTEVVGVPMLSVLKALTGFWRKCSELHCSFFKLRSI
ncbi:hypothetical protein SETIT_8G154500v2 [Setaria italica]|uniref:Uncharacterized protein n=1 Tax=Setaria italica TaxID=4555 RepID=A0A368S839_SETIT|nr:hypothetical protein SETIT_8G154500v2 [Setaria italica]